MQVGKQGRNWWSRVRSTVRTMIGLERAAIGKVVVDRRGSALDELLVLMFALLSLARVLTVQCGTSCFLFFTELGPVCWLKFVGFRLVPRHF